MAKLDTRKKPAPQDWSSHYIVFRLRERGMTLRRLSRLNGYSANAATVAIGIAWTKMELLIATAIGVAPQEIWPSRYHADGSPRGPRRRARFLKHSTAPARRNARTAGAN